MKFITFVAPGLGSLSSDLVAKMAAEIATESGVSIEKIIAHQWDVNEDSDLEELTTHSITPTIDEVLKGSIKVINEIESEASTSTQFTIAIIRLLDCGPKESLVRNAIRCIVTYNDPSRLFTKAFGLKAKTYQILKDLYNNNFV